MTLSGKQVAMIAAAIMFTSIGAIAGLVAGYLLWHQDPVKPIVETFKPQVEHDDGSVTGAVVPGKKPELPAPTKPQGGKVVRVVEVVVKPETPKVDVPPGCPVVECPTVSLRLDVTRHEDGLRFTGKATPGEVLEILDYPIEPIVVPAPPRNSIAAMQFEGGYTSVTYSRSFAKLDLSAGALRDPDNRVMAGVGVEVRF
jgi:hypothetical protein